MNKKVTMKLAMYERVLATLRGKQNLLTNSPALTSCVDKLDAEISILRTNLYLHTQDLTWIASRKQYLTDEMMTKAFRINKVLIAYWTSTDNRDMVNRFDCNVKDFAKGGAYGKLVRVKNLLEIVPEFLGALGAFGVAQPELDKLADLYNELDGIVNSTRSALNNRKVITNSIAEHLKKIDHLLYIEIDASMEVFKPLNTTDYLEYRAARKLVHYATKSKKPGANSSDVDDGSDV